MLNYPQTTSEEDILVRSLYTDDTPQRICTTRQAADLALQVAQRTDQEWLVIFYFNNAQQILETYGPILGLSCARLIDPGEHCVRGTKLCARSLVLVRYHPHPWAYLPRALEAFYTWEYVAGYVDIRLQDVLILDSQEQLFSFRGERAWGGMQSIKGVGEV